MSSDLERIKESIGPIDPLIALFLAKGENDQNDPNSVYEDRIGPFDQQTLLYFSAWGRARYDGPKRNAGIRTKLSLDNAVIAADFSFEGESQRITFDSTVTTFAFLDADTRYTLRAEREDNACNSGFRLRTFWIVTPAIDATGVL